MRATSQRVQPRARLALELASIFLTFAAMSLLVVYFGSGSFVRPVEIDNWLIAIFWLLGALTLAVSGALPVLRRSSQNLERLGAGARIASAALLVLAFLIATDLGILFVSHNYWINKANRAPTVEDAQRYLNIVFSSTQYGRDVALNDISRLPEGERKRELEAAWRELAAQNQR